MSVNSSTFFINTPLEGMIVDLPFFLKGNILPVLYTLDGGVKTYVALDDPRIFSLQLIGPDVLRATFAGEYLGYIQLISLIDNDISSVDRINMITSTLGAQSKAISERVYMDSWKEMNNYFQAEILVLQKEIETLNAVTKSLMAQVQDLLSK